MATWPVVLLALAAAACAAPPQTRPAAELFRDDRFAAPAQPPDAAAIFAVDAAMRRYLREEIAGQLETHGRPRGLYEALYRRGQLKLEYDAERTRTAAEAFAARTGNCMSLVVMTAALAKELGLAVRYHRSFAQESWSRSGELYFSVGHVNLTLGRRSTDPRQRYNESTFLTIDFQPRPEHARYHGYELREATVAAMFMNNRAAEALAAGRVDDAYWWARAAILQDPRFLSAVNTLGVVYRHHGDLRQAEAALAHVLALEPGNLHALSNLALVLRDQGRAAESAELTARLARLEPQPPFHYLHLGIAAMQAGDFVAARDHFTREVERDAFYHEFHFWLAAAHFGLGDLRLARHHLDIAIENSTSQNERELYAAKLGRLTRPETQLSLPLGAMPGRAR